MTEDGFLRDHEPELFADGERMLVRGAKEVSLLSFRGRYWHVLNLDSHFRWFLWESLASVVWNIIYCIASGNASDSRSQP